LQLARALNKINKTTNRYRHLSTDNAFVGPTEPNFGYRLSRAIYPVFRMLFPSQMIRADDLARVMVDVAARRTKERRASVFENNDIRAMVECLRRLAG
jgi:hypothetical protein